MKKSVISRKQLVTPYAVFLVLFVILPLLVIIYFGFTNGEGDISFDNFFNFFKNGKTIGTLIYSVVIAVVTTVICLILAYPVAFILAKGSFSKSQAFLMLFVLPMWINFTLRITALKEILTLIEGNLAYHPFLNTIICMVYDFLPFMVLPLYNSLTKLDDSLIEAASDLGATKKHIFFKVILPLSVPGIISGVTMVFLPSMTNYVVLDMVYNSTYIMGSLIGSYFSSYDWHNGSVISIILLIIICIITLVSNKFTEKNTNTRVNTLY
ncbi:MAG: ABC transporter permease [Lachnospiraceae bacterium]|nr:ABC transporter permease [Lachnospiraceae bacterium]